MTTLAGLHLRARRGAALMMVMVILALLLVLAVSFTFLMTQQEGTSVASLAGEETRIVTRTGADHAYARLNQGNRLNEFAAWFALRPSEVTNQTNPWIDGYDESVVDLLYDFEGADGATPSFPGLIGPNRQPLFRVEDPKRLVLGVNVQDESGKINLNFATPHLVANLLGSATTTAQIDPVGGVYDPVPVTDASFLIPYDEDANPTDSRYGGGLVVIDGALFSYASRNGNLLNRVEPNPPYNGPLMDRGMNQLFRWWDPRRSIDHGAFVTTPTPYKIAFRRYLERGKGVEPSLFNNLGEVRQIAEMNRWFNAAGALGPYIFDKKMSGWPEGIDPVMYQRLERLATTVAPTERFDGGWFYPHVVRSAAMAQDPAGYWYFACNYDNQQAFQANYYVFNDPRSPNPAQLDYSKSGIGIGHLVRLRRADGQLIYGVVGGNGIVVSGDYTINAGEPWLMETAECGNVNINTAPLEVIESVFHGIGPRSKDPDKHPIERDQARRIALEIIGRIRGTDTAEPQPFTSIDDLGGFLVALSQRDDTIIQPRQIPFFLNSQYFPYSGQTVPTTQFSYASLDTFMVDSFATRYQPSGGAMARRAFREWTSVGSDRPQEYVWRTYVQWLDEMRRPQGNIFSLFDGGTMGGNGKLVGVHELPFVHYQPDERYMRGRFDAPWTANTPRNMNAMGDNSKRPEKFYSNVAMKTPGGGGADFEAGDLEAGMFSFWYRPQWGDYNANHYIFDSAEQEFSNRVSLLWWGQRQRGYRLSQHNSGLTLRVKDRTLEEGYTELRYELDPNQFQTNDWYHLNLNWKGTSLSHLSLLLDGDCTSGSQPVRPQMDHTFRQVNGAWVSRTSTLQQDMEDPRNGGMTTTEIYVDAADIAAFPPRGVIQIGDEAIEYNGNNGFALLAIYRGPPVISPLTGTAIPNSARGARGTTANFHPRGSKVTVFGYVSAIGRFQANNNNPLQPRFPHLPATGGHMRSTMGNQGIYRVSKNGGINPIYYRPVELGPDAGFAGGGDDTRGGDPYHLPLADYTGLSNHGIVAVYGFGWRGYHPPGTPGIPQAGVWFPDFDPNTPGVETVLQVPTDLKFEYVAYDRIDPNGLHVLQRYDQNFAIKDPALWFHFLGTYSNLIQPSNPADPTNVNQINFFTAGTCVIPVSLDMDSIAGYHDRSIVQVDDEWFFYNRIWDPAARPTTDLLTMLFCLNPQALIAWVIQNASSDTKTPNPWPFFRGQHNTGFGNHNAGTDVLPTFATDWTTGEFDVVTTIMDKNNTKELHRIRRQRRITNGNNNVANDADDVWLAAFYEPCQTDYFPNLQPNNPYNRGNLAKFPTGELPVELPTDWQFAGADPRSPEATSTDANFDSFELRMYTKGNFRLVQHMTDNYPGEGGEIQVNTPLPPNLGVVKIDDELIAYRLTEVRNVPVTQPNGTVINVDTYWLVDITRGILGTTIHAHSGGTPMMNMASLRVARPTASGSPQTNLFQTILGEESMRPYGFVRIVEGGSLELAGYQKYQEVATLDPATNVTTRTASLTSGLYNDYALPQALFRGVYGTQARPFSTRALMFDQPVRFPDFFPGYHQEPGGGLVYAPWHSAGDEGIPGARSPEISHIQGSATFRNALFENFKWRVAWLPHAEQTRYQFGLGARLVMRFRGRGAMERIPDWGEVPTNKPGGLYSFEFDFNGPNTQSLQLSAFEQTEDFTQGGRAAPIRADGVEWRVYFYFKQNAFTNDLYKATLQFQGASTTVDQLTQVLRHEEKR
ncbi:MAG: hypothetical protein IPP14_07425 [Planctomycetes bacterium]|nr:hypothetical protein [Planctomycetota bacterium]